MSRNIIIHEAMPRIDMTNVLRYLVKIYGGKKIKPLLDEGLIVMLPFPECVVKIRLGVYEFSIYLRWHPGITILDEDFQDADNVLSMDVALGHTSDRYARLYNAHFAVDSDGHLISSKALVSISEEDEHARNNFYLLSRCVLFGISLMHCRNVELRDMPLSRQVRRKHERKGSQPVIMKTNGDRPRFIYAVTHKMSGTHFIRHIFLELDEAMTYAQGLGEPAPMIAKYDFDESFFIELADSSKLWRTRDA